MKCVIYGKLHFKKYLPTQKDSVYTDSMTFFVQRDQMTI